MSRCLQLNGWRIIGRDELDNNQLQEPPLSAPTGVGIRDSRAKSCPYLRGQETLRVPRPLSLNEIADVVQDFRRAALNAIDAGVDGIQLHASNGYLIDQFLRDSANLRVIDTAGRLKTASGF
ncbi:oxidoreductase [Agrobacterium pusense]|uniref:oxidoreductase n=1 Tax=Agrobacterium pusense TaxID=648995 RepID=UPI004041F06C